MRYWFLFIFSIFFFIPSGAEASLVINEISWQGYLGDANNEWIELFNSSGEDINLDDWFLEASDGTPSINLSGLTVGSEDFVLLERTDDTTVPEETASLFYSGALSNEGESLILKNSSGSVVDSANFSSGWDDMESSSVGTMSRFGNSWNEGEATPKAQNISLESENNDDEEEGNNENENQEDEESDEERDEDKDEEEIKGKTVLKEPKGRIESQNQSFVGIAVSFNSFLTDIDSDEIRRGIYVWNMGDGSVIYKTKKEPFEYTYQYPGEYVVSLSFNKLDFGKEVTELNPYIYDEHVITITDNSITIEDFKQDGTLILKNNASHSLNLSGWVLQNSDSKFTVPKHTTVRPGKTITFSASVTKLSYKPITVLNPAGSLVDYSEKQKQEEQGVSLQKSTQEEGDATSPNEIPEVLGVSSINLEPESSLVSFSEQRTMYIGLFVLLTILIGIIVWLLFSAGKTKEDDVVEYRIIEE